MLVKRHRDARWKFAREHKEKEKSYWETVLYGQTNPKLSCLDVILDVWREDGCAFKTKHTILTVKSVVAASWSRDVFLQMVLATYQ